MSDDNQQDNVTEAPFSANWRMFDEDGLAVQMTLRADTPDKMSNLMVFLDGLKFTLTKFKAMGFTIADPRTSTMMAREQASQNRADLSKGEEEEEADLYMVVEQSGGTTIFLYNSQFGRDVCIGKVYTEKRGTLPWVLDITNVKRWKSKAPLEKPAGIDMGLIQPLPNKFRYVRALRPAKKAGHMDSKPYDRTIAVFDAAGNGIPWKPVGVEIEDNEEPTPPAPEPATRQPAAPPPPSAPAGWEEPQPQYGADDDPFDMRTPKQSALDPAAAAAEAAAQKAADQVIANARIAFQQAITATIQPPLTGTDVEHVNVKATKWLTEQWMRQMNQRPNVTDVNLLTLYDLTELTNRLLSPVKGPGLRAAYDELLQFEKIAADAAAAA